jgi:hypothetical protein
MTENETAPPMARRGGKTSNASRSSTPRHDSPARAFIHRWRSAVFNSDLPPTSRVTLLALAEFADSDGANCYPAVTSVAKIAGVNEKTGRRTLAAAEKSGWFAREERQGQGHAWRQYGYRLLLPEAADTTPARQATRRADSVPAPHIEAADTTPAPSDETCGLSRPNVRTLTPERAGTAPYELALDLALEIGKEKNALTSDGKAVLWRRAVELLTKSGSSEKKARSIIGKLRQILQNDDARLLEIVDAAEREEIQDPVSWLMAAARQRVHHAPAPLYRSDPVADEAALDAVFERMGVAT